MARLVAANLERDGFEVAIRGDGPSAAAAARAVTRTCWSVSRAPLVWELMKAPMMVRWVLVSFPVDLAIRKYPVGVFSLTLPKDGFPRREPRGTRRQR
jgi:hypothetical protein